MTHPRPKIPTAIKAEVLNEYSHLCAICGCPNPQLHHLDENRENNVPLNLLPLCPNHHLSDQHNPTRRIDPKRLSLFRIYKDPTILQPQFVPLFERFQFIYEVENNEAGNEWQSASGELVAFLREMQMGAFYSSKINELLAAPIDAYSLTAGLGGGYDEAAARRSEQKWIAEYRQQLTTIRPKVEKLVVEILRFQNWPVSFARK